MDVTFAFDLAGLRKQARLGQREVIANLPLYKGRKVTPDFYTRIESCQVAIEQDYYETMKAVIAEHSREAVA